jgi:hypothetical protein
VWWKNVKNVPHPHTRECALVLCYDSNLEKQECVQYTGIFLAQVCMKKVTLFSKRKRTSSRSGEQLFQWLS